MFIVLQIVRIAEKPDFAGMLLQLDCFACVLSALPPQADSHG